MEWKDKQTMVDLANEKDMQGLISFVEKHSKEFDSQAWDVLLNCDEITQENIENNVEFFSMVFNSVIHTDGVEKDLGLRGVLRLGFIEGFLGLIKEAN